MNDELRRRLRESADAHRPDRERMLARIERGMSGPRAAVPQRQGPAVGWVRIAGATAGVAGALAVGGFTVGAALQQDDGPRQNVAVTPTPTAARTPTADSTATATVDGPLWSDGSVDPGSNDYWAQSDVKFKTKRQLTALTVELRVAQTGNVADTGNWRTLPADDFTVSVAERGGFLVYRWVLKDGRTVPAGEYVFAGQFDHARGGRDAGRDRYSVSGRTADGEQAAVGGDFA
ncbi:hypothetical protein [Streptomyces sp. NPDC050264]|uniref:hypothetical protein n=1 Tax=Streptomyces sp. NPDC050264 TaxID=3155038 RepID=UPI00343908AC